MKKSKLASSIELNLIKTDIDKLKIGGIDDETLSTKVETAIEASSVINSIKTDNINKTTTVTLEMFGGGSDATPEQNDAAFIAAMRSGYNIEFRRNAIYEFTGNMIDLSDLGDKRVFYGNDASIRKLSFKYNITSDNQRVTTSMVKHFTLEFRDLLFSNCNIILITLSNVSVKRCNFVNCNNIFGFPEFYVDYFHMSDCAFYNCDNIIIGANYDGTLFDYGMYGDWITFERCSFGLNCNVYKSHPNHNSYVFVNNCLHGIFTINQSAYYRTKLTISGSHFENRIPIINNNTPDIPIPKGYITIKDSYFYSSAVPINVDFEFNNSEINFSNNVSTGNNRLFVGEKGKYIRTNNAARIFFDEIKFFSHDKSNIPVASTYAVLEETSSTNIVRYSESHTMKYIICTSLEKDRLFFNGESIPLDWTQSITISPNRGIACFAYINRDLIKNVYVHIYKDMDGKIFRVVIPVTEWLVVHDKLSDRKNYILFYDEPHGICGCPWEEYDGNIEYETV